MVSLQNARDLFAALKRERDHAAAVVLAFKVAELVPGLVQYAERLESSVKRNVRHVVCLCEWCGKQFKVFHSEMKDGRKAGRFCSRECIAAKREAERQPEKVETPT